MTGEWRPASDADLSRRVAASFERAVVERSERAMVALREATIALAIAMRATSIRPERAVIMLKEAVRGHGGAGWAPSITVERGEAPAAPEALIYDTLFGWWVSAYYADAVPELPAERTPTPAAGA